MIDTDSIYDDGAVYGSATDASTEPDHSGIYDDGATYGSEHTPTDLP